MDPGGDAHDALPMPSLAARLAVRERPDGPPAGWQAWRRLLFGHWPMPPEALRPLVPADLSLDLYEGSAWVSLVPFVVQMARPLGAPRSLGLRFLETNVRTYVHRQGREPGVYFFSLDAASWLAVVGARVAFGLPYLYAQGRERVSAGGVEYHLRRRARGRPAVAARYRVGQSLGPAAPGTLDFFLIERYLLHVQRGPSLWTVQVHHTPYPLQQVHLEALADRLMVADGLPEPSGTPLVHFSPGVDVAVYPPRIRWRR
jgi:uncharacterized protein YqjF (DUF2071 family)